MSEQRNVKFVVEYEGTNYHGWQSQENAVTVQDTLESAIESLIQVKVRVTAAGRTDTGVHARGQVVNFHMQKQINPYNIRMGINANLPKDIIVKSVEEVPPDFHARFDARQRIYQYFIMQSQTAIFRRFCWQFFQEIDFNKLQILSQKILGKHDFASFSRFDTSSKNKFCEVFESSWRKEGDFLIFRIAANRFLHGMVRTLVGTMIDVARGHFATNQFDRIFSLRDRSQAGQTAPACGLFREQVVYHEHVRGKNEITI